MEGLNIKVLEHVHDRDAGVYRIVVGQVQLTEYERELIGDDGAPILDDDGVAMTTIEEEEVVVATEDFVWADDDERWDKKTPQQIAQTQRWEVREALLKRMEEAQAQAARSQVTELPGSVGETLMSETP